MRSLLSLISIVLFISINAYGQGKTIDEIVAVVGDEIILFSDIQIQKNQLKQQGYAGTLSDCDVLEEILFEKLMLNQSKIDSLEVTDDMVNVELEKRLAVFIRQIGSIEKLEEYYGKSIREIREEFFDVLKDQILVQRMQGTIADGLNVTPQDVSEFYSSIPTDSLPFINASVELAQIVKYPEISREETDRVRNRLREFKQQAESGKEEFETLAALYSEDPGSSAKGGDLGMQPRGTWVPEFDAVAFNLKDGEVSAPFKTEFGWHIMQMIERRGEMYSANHILLVLKTSSTELTQAQAELDSIRKLVVRDSVSFAFAASKYSDDERSKNQNGMMVNNAKGSTIFEMSELDPTVFMAIDTLSLGQVSSAFYFQGDDRKQGYRIIKLISETEPHRANMQDDYQALQNMASQKLSAENMDRWVKQKISDTFIKVNVEYQKCDFSYPWLKPEDETSKIK